jgi:hypothetical protein
VHRNPSLVELHGSVLVTLLRLQSCEHARRAVTLAASPGSTSTLTWASSSRGKYASSGVRTRLKSGTSHLRGEGGGNGAMTPDAPPRFHAAQGPSPVV